MTTEAPALRLCQPFGEQHDTASNLSLAGGTLSWGACSLAPYGPLIVWKSDIILQDIL